MAEKRRGLGRGLGALIPSAPSGDARPVDVFFPDRGASPPVLDGDSLSENRSAASDSVDFEIVHPSGAAGSGAVPAPGSGDGSSDLVPVPGAHFAEIPLERITPNPRQPRSVFDPDELEELATSVREIGVLQPVVVRPVAVTSADSPAREPISTWATCSTRRVRPVAPISVICSVACSVAVLSSRDPAVRGVATTWKPRPNCRSWRRPRAWRCRCG